MGDFVEKDIYGRGADIIFGKGAAELTKRQALLKLKAIRDAKAQIKPGEYIEYDLYGRGDPRIFGKNAHIANYKQAAKELARRQRPDRFSLRKALQLPSSKVRQVLKLLKRKSLSDSASEGVDEEDRGLIDTSYSGRAADKNEDGLTEETQYSSFNIRGSSAHEPSPAQYSRPGSLTSNSSAESPTALAFANRVISIRTNRDGGMQAVFREIHSQEDVSGEGHAQNNRSVEHSTPTKLETDSEPVRDVIAVSGLRKLFETSEDTETVPLNNTEVYRESSVGADSTTTSRSKSAYSCLGSLDHENSSSARVRFRPSVSRSESSYESAHRIHSKSIHTESSIGNFDCTENSSENDATVTSDFSFSRKESGHVAERPLVPVGPLSTLFAEAQVASNDHNDFTRSDPDAVLEDSGASFLATGKELDLSKSATEEPLIVPTSVSALSKLLPETRELDPEPNIDSATFSSQNIKRYQSVSEHRDQTSFENSLSRVRDEHTDHTREFVHIASDNVKDSSHAAEPSPVSLSGLAKLFSGTLDGDEDKNRESVSHSSHASAQPYTDVGDVELYYSPERTPHAADTKSESEGSTSSKSGPDGVFEDVNPVVEIPSSESESSSVPQDDDLGSWSSDLVEPVVVCNSVSLDLEALGLEEGAVVSRQQTSSESSSEIDFDNLDSAPEQNTAVSPHGSSKDDSAKVVHDDDLEHVRQKSADDGLQTTSNVKSNQSSVLSSKEEPKKMTKTKSKGFWERLFGFSKSPEDTNQQSVDETISARDLADASIQVPPRVHPGDDIAHEKTGTSSTQDLARNDMSEEKRFSSGAGPSSTPRPTFASAKFDSNDQTVNMEDSSSSTNSEAADPNADQAGNHDRSARRNSPKQFPRGKSNIKRADTLLDVRINSAARSVHMQPDSRIVEQSSLMPAADHVTRRGTEHPDVVQESTMVAIETADGHSGVHSRGESGSREEAPHANTATTDSGYGSFGSSDEFNHVDRYSGAHSSGETDSGEASSHMNAVTTDSAYDSVGSSDDYI